MTPRATGAVALRVLRQVRRDPRTVVMLVLLPTLLMALLAWLWSGQPAGPDGRDLFDRVGPALLAVFPLFVMFLVASVTTLRERTSGTLERLLAMPMGKLDFLLGYAIAFGLLGVLQAGLAVAVSVALLGLEVDGPVGLLLLVAVADALVGTALGLFVSAFARTEFQAVQFMPAVVVPQILLCGLLRPRDDLPEGLRQVSDLLPLSWAVDAMQEVVAGGDGSKVWWQLLVLLGWVLLALALGAATLRRRTL